jgi:hypothetical protein
MALQVDSRVVGSGAEDPEAPAQALERLWLSRRTRCHEPGPPQGAHTRRDRKEDGNRCGMRRGFFASWEGSIS